jgi:uncharacterized protein
MKIVELISSELNLDFLRVKNCIELLEEGCTIPFISRYRKERTKSLDEIEIENIYNLQKKYIELEKRKETILNAIESQNKLNDDLKSKILNCWNSTSLEDMYLPFKKKKRTKAEIARERGLTPLANVIFLQNNKVSEKFISKFIKEEVKTPEEAIIGAQHIISEEINENINFRELVRNDIKAYGIISSKLVKSKEEEAEKFKDYFEFSENINRCASHRLLALKRGEKLGYLKIKLEADPEITISKLRRAIVKNKTNLEFLEPAIEDAYKRLIQPSIENELKNLFKEKADVESIKVFSENLKQLLLSAPLGEKRVLAIDPGFRTGCKIVCLNEHGDLLHNDIIYPHEPQRETGKAKAKLNTLVQQYNIESIAIGNGTASRETENLVKSTKFNKDIEVYTVSESGASIYSASKVGRDEFPNYDVTVRSSVSIGRRLQDPLAELVKLDPKTIGVGQYQHDVDQTMLKDSLNQVVENCVNKIGINLNTASEHILTHISGLGPQLAKNIISYRRENEQFVDRKELNKVEKLGPKAFNLCAGFLRVKSGKNPLDNTAIHPESYSIVKKIAKNLNISINELLGNKDALGKIQLNNYIDDKIGIETLTDIIKELEKPGNDVRRKIEQFNFNRNIRKIDDLETNQILPGIITNITKFGAFVDVGIKENGLVHVSEICDEFISDPSEKLKLNQKLIVRVKEVDYSRKRIQLSLKNIK